MNEKTYQEKFYQIAQRQLFALQQQLHPLQLTAISMLEDYEEVDQELSQLEQIIADLQERYSNREDKLMEARHNGQQ